MLGLSVPRNVTQPIPAKKNTFQQKNKTRQLILSALELICKIVMTKCNENQQKQLLYNMQRITHPEEQLQYNDVSEKCGNV